MNDAVKRALRVFISLSPVDQEAFINEINRYRRVLPSEQRQIREDLSTIITKVATGPMGGACPYCGR